MNSTIQKLDDVKDALVKTYEKYHIKGYSSSTFNYNEFLSNIEYQEARLILRKLSKEMNINLDESFENNRTVRELLEDLSYASSYSHQNMSGYIASTMNKYSTYLEDNLYKIEIVKIDCEVPKDLTYEGIRQDLIKCEARLESKDYAGAITSAKTLVEGVCKELLLLKGLEENSNKDNLPKLYTELTKLLNLNSSNPKLDDSLREITSGLNKIIKGLAEVRNNAGDSHAKTNPQPAFHHAVLAVNAAKTVTSFLFQTYEYQNSK